MCQDLEPCWTGVSTLVSKDKRFTRIRFPRIRLPWILHSRMWCVRIYNFVVPVLSTLVCRDKRFPRLRFQRIHLPGYGVLEMVCPDLESGGSGSEDNGLQR